MDHRSLYKAKTASDKNTKTKRIEKLRANRTANRNEIHQIGRNITVIDDDFPSDDEVIHPNPVIKVPEVKATKKEEYLKKFAAWKEEKMKEKQTSIVNKKPVFCSAVPTSTTFAPSNYVFKAPATVRQYKNTIPEPKTLLKPIKQKVIPKKFSPRVTRSKTVAKKVPTVQIPKKVPTSAKVKSNTKLLVPAKSDKKPLRLNMKNNNDVLKKPKIRLVRDNFPFSVDGTKVTSTSRKSKCETFSENLKPVEIPFDTISPIEITPAKLIKMNELAEIKTSQRSTSRKRRLSLEKINSNVKSENTAPETIVRNPIILLEKIKCSIQKRKTIHMDKIDSGKKKVQRKSLVMKSENIVPNDLNSTPVNSCVLNTSLTYMSPFVSTARGKGSAKREKRNRDSVYKPNGSTEEPKELRQGREAGIYFRKILQDEIDRLLALCDEWSKYKSDNEATIISDHIDSIDVAIGQAKLLINKKFEQFRTLIVQCEQHTGEQKVLPEDLEGFWAMVYMQVENIDKRFKDLSAWRDNGWEDPIKQLEKIVKRKKSAGRSSPANVKTRNTVRKNTISSHNPIKNLIQRARKELMEKNKRKSKDAVKHDIENVETAENAKQMEQFVNSPMRKRKSLLTTVLLSEARKSSSKRRRFSKEKENFVESLIYQQPPSIKNDNDTPIKSILKTPGVTRKGKGVVFTEPKNYVTPIRLSTPSCDVILDDDDDDDNNYSDHCNKKRRTTDNEKYRTTPYNKKCNTLTPIVNIRNCDDVLIKRRVSKRITINSQPQFDE